MENIVAKGEIACFNPSAAEASESVKIKLSFHFWWTPCVYFSCFDNASQGKSGHISSIFPVAAVFENNHAKIHHIASTSGKGLKPSEAQIIMVA